MNKDIDNALDELLLVRPVSQDDIAQAYRRMAKRFHPDKATDADEKEWVQKKFLRIQQAYEVLKVLPVEILNAQKEAVLQNTEPEKCQKKEDIKQEKPWSVVPTALAVFVGLPVAMVVLSFLGATFLKSTVPKQASGTPKTAALSLTRQPSSSPSDRLVGRWRNIDNGCEVIYSPVDPSLGFGTYRLRNDTRRLSSPIRFKVISEDASGTRLVIREFNKERERLGMTLAVR